MTQPTPLTDGKAMHPDEWDDEDADCNECGGEGFVHDCIDGSCADAEVGCDLCTEPCGVCNYKMLAEIG